MIDVARIVARIASARQARACAVAGRTGFRRGWTLVDAWPPSACGFVNVPQMNVVDVAFRAPRCARARGRVPPLAGERTEIAPSRDRGTPIRDPRVDGRDLEATGEWKPADRAEFRRSARSERL